MNQKKVVIGILAVLVFGGIFSYSQKIKTEKQEESNQQTSQLIQEPQKQQIEGMITYEIPEYGMKIGIAPWQSHRVGTYDFMRTEMKKRGQLLVWYEIPELEIKFLVTPDTKKDLRYKLRAMPSDDSEGVRNASFYYQSVADITDCDVNGEITCSNLSLSSVLIEKIGAYQSKNGSPFCGSMEESHLVGAREFCVRYRNDFQLTAEQEKEYQKKHKDIFLGILPETLQSM